MRRLIKLFNQHSLLNGASNNEMYMYIAHSMSNLINDAFNNEFSDTFTYTVE